MATVDAEHHELELRIMVVGGACDLLLSGLQLVNGTMQLGELQGWRPSLAFRSFPVDPWAGDGAPGRELQAFVPYVDGLILTDALGEGQHYSSTALERLSRVLGPTKAGVPAAIFGLHAMEEEWTTLAGVKPVIVAEPRSEQALGVVKALAAALLRSRMRSIPPPPPGPVD
jgi:hypothetical protein